MVFDFIFYCVTVKTLYTLILLKMTAQSQNPNACKHYKQLTQWNANRCYSLRTTYLIFEPFQILFPTASLIFTAVKLFHELIRERTKY